MFELIRHDRVSILDLVPSHLRTCIQALTQLDRENQSALLQNDLRLVLSASEPLASDIPRGWARLLGNRAKMINMFGQTETSGIVTVYPIPDIPDAERGSADRSPDFEFYGIPAGCFPAPRSDWRPWRSLCRWELCWGGLS
jgi:acyl-coenzyme A synthetase/AMP-(fatty) acid ligase